MYNISEIKLQHKYDSWVFWYMYIADSVMEICGRSGEKIIRKAVAKSAEMQGESLRKKHVELGIYTNIKGLYKYGCGALNDPRVIENVIEESAEERFWEIYTDPMCHILQNANKQYLGLVFSEEYQLALLKAYTMGKGQMNLSKNIHCSRDNHSRYSAYFRPANTVGEHRKEAFPPIGEASPEYDIPPMDFTTYVEELARLFYLNILDLAEIERGKEGISAVAEGVKNYCKDIIPIMKKHADNTARNYDEKLYEDYFVFTVKHLNCENKMGMKIFNTVLIDTINSSLVK